MPALPIPLAAIRQPAFRYGPDGRVAEANDRAEALAGQPLVGRSAADLIEIFGLRSLDGTPFRAADLPATRALRGEEAVDDTPLAVRTADGRTMHVLSSASPLRDEHGPAGALAIWQDVSALEAARVEQSRLRAESEARALELEGQREALRANEERLRIALEAADLGTWDLDLTTDVAVRSLRHDQILGYRELQPEWGLEIALRHMDAEGRRIVTEAHARARETGVLSHENRVVWPDGSIHWITAEGRVHYDADGRPVRIVGVVADVTERKLAEEALRKSGEELRKANVAAIRERDRVRNLLEIAGAMILAIDTEGRVIMINRRGCEILGYSEEEILGKDWVETFLPERFRGDQHEAFRRLIAGTIRDLERNENPVLARDGEERHILWSNRLITDEDGRITGILSSGEDITDRKRVEEELGQAYERTTAILESISDSFMALDRDWRFTYINRRALGYSAKTPADVIGRSVWEVYPEILGTPLEAFYRTAMESREPLTFENPSVVATGRQFELRAYPAEEGVSIFGRDITERKLFEHALAESEADARSFMENMVDACAICETAYDADGTPVDIRVVDLNPALARELGLPASAIVGRTAFELLPELATPWFDRFLEVGRSGRAVEVEEPFPALGRWYRVVGFPVRGGRTAVLFRDITLRKEAEEALAESEERYRSLVENSIDAVLLTAPDGAILAANAEACRIFGMTEEEIVGGGRYGIVDPSDPRLAAALEERARTGRFRGELTLRRTDGTTFPGEVSTALFTDRSGAVRTTMIIRDVTDRREAEASLQEYAERLRASNEELQRFAYVASHDLQEPLRSIVSFSQLLERRYRGRLDRDADDYIAFIVEGGNRMQALIRDLLQVSRVETGAKPPVPTDANAVVAGVVRAMETSLREAGATVTVGDLPVVMADAAQLEQVFVNLVGNAIKYRRPGVPPEVRISARRQGDWWEFAVQDNGIGIEPEYHDRIFEMFRRLHTHDQYEGTGIGLAVVKKIVERHGGKVRVASTPGEGTTFFFTLPTA